MKLITTLHVRTAIALLSVLLGISTVGRVHAEEEVVYATFIGDKDRFNSKGERLTTIAEILRQDRANYHSGKGERREQDDGGIFATQKGRAKFDSYKIVLQNLKPAQVIRGDCGSVVVRVIGKKIYVEQVE